MYLYQVYRTDGAAVNSHTADSQRFILSLCPSARISIKCNDRLIKCESRSMRLLRWSKNEPSCHLKSR